MNDINKVANMVKMEEEHASSITASIRDIGNPVLQRVLRGVAHDSQKHAGIYAAILDLLKGGSETVTEQDYRRIESVLKRHVEREEEMIKEAKEIEENQQDTRVKSLIGEILQDEMWHHSFMTRLLDVVSKKENPLDESFWGAIFAGPPE